MSSPTPDEIDGLKAQLSEAARRRLESVEDYLALSAKLQQAGRTIGDRGEQIRRLQLEQQDRDAELQAARADLEALVWMLQESERAQERADLRTPLGLLRSLVKPRARKAVRIPPGDFVYHLSTSPFRIYRGKEFTLRGWAFPRDGRALTAIRVRLDEQEFAGKSGLPAPEASRESLAHPRHPPPGFEVTFATPPGRHQLALEARLNEDVWSSILIVPIWCRPDAKGESRG